MRLKGISDQGFTRLSFIKTGAESNNESEAVKVLIGWLLDVLKSYKETRMGYSDEEELSYYEGKEHAYEEVLDKVKELFGE